MALSVHSVDQHGQKTGNVRLELARPKTESDLQSPEGRLAAALATQSVCGHQLRDRERIAVDVSADDFC